jgi:hypothetical protein
MPTPETYTLREVQAFIKTLPQADQDAVDNHARHLRNYLVLNGAPAGVALALVGAELAVDQ